MANIRRSPNNDSVLWAVSDITGKSEALTSNNGILNVSGTGGGGGGAATIADGADVTQGAVADAAVTAGTGGTISGKLRTISADTARPLQLEDAPHSSASSGMFVLGVRQDSDVSPVSTDGDYHGIIFNSIGRVKISMLPAFTTAVTGSITNNATLVPVDVSRQGNVTVQITGTYAGINMTFEGSVDGGTTYFAVQAAQLGSNTAETTSGVLGSTTRAWRVSTAALSNFRVRSTAYTSGTGAITIQPGALAIEPTPVIPTHAVTLTSTTLTSVTPGTAAANLGKAEDAAHTSGDTGVMTLGVRNDNAATTLTSATGDYSPIATDSSGRQFLATATTGGATPYSYIAAATTNATNVKAAAGTVYSLVAMNTSASARYVKLYNSASAPTAGSGTPIKRFLIPAGGGFVWPIPSQGVAFSAGIGFTITGGVTDADTTATAASDVLLNLDYV